MDRDRMVRDGQAMGGGVGRSRSGDGRQVVDGKAETRLQVGGGMRAHFEEVVLLVLGLLAIGSWVILTRWYSLLENRSNTHFAFEKIPGHFDSPIIRNTALLFLQISLIYFVGYLLIKSARSITIPIKLGMALLVVGPAIANILIYPVGALDVFNYMIELKLAFHYDQNPYLVTFEAFRSDPFALPAFLVNVPLFYGPAWLLLSVLPALVVGFDDFVHLLIGLKILNLGLLALTAVAIFKYQENERRGWLAAYTLMANPLVLFEGVANGHNDVMMTLFLVLALLALKRQSVLAWPLLALSALVKFFTAALIPLFAVVMLLGGWGKRKLAASALLALVVVVALSAPFWADGKMVTGLVKGTATSQEMDHVSVLSLAQQFRWQVRVADEEPWRSALLSPQRPLGPLRSEDRAPVQRVFAGVFAVLVLAIAWTVKRGRGVEPVVVDTLMLFSLLLTNLYAWYLIPLFAVLALRQRVLGMSYVFVATALGLLYYPMYVYAHFTSGWMKFHVHLFLALFLTVPMVTFLALELVAFAFARLRRTGRDHESSVGAAAGDEANRGSGLGAAGRSVSGLERPARS